MPNNVTGYLTWNEGKGGIAWDPVAKTEPKTRDTGTCAPLPTQTCSASSFQGDMSFTFESAPTPFTFYLNVSQDIAVDGVQRVTATNGAARDGVVTVRAAGRIFGQSVQGSTWSSCNESGCPTNFWTSRGTEWAAWAWRSAPRTLVIPAGTVLHLDVNLTGYAVTQLSLAGPQRNIVRFAILPPEEAFFRYPELFPDQARPDTPAPEVLTGPTAAATLGFPFLFAAGRRNRHAAILLLLALPAIAGCVQPSTGEDDAGNGGDSQTRIIPQDEDLPVVPGAGSLQGFVRDAIGRPVVGATVIVQETYNVSTTTAYGRFEFLNLPAAGYTLRITKDGYATLVTRVYVVAQNLTLVNIKLTSLVADLTSSHSHEYWGTAKSLTLMDDAVPNTCRPGTSLADDDAAGDLYQTCYDGRGFGVPEKRPGTQLPNLIVRGTGELAVTFTWSDPAAPSKVGFYYRPNDGHGRWLPGVPSGQTMRIPVHWDLTDPGHSLLTAWQFGYFIPFEDPYWGYSSSPTGKNEHINEQWTIDVHIELIRFGSLPIERPHPDPWGSTDVLDVAKVPWYQPSVAVHRIATVANLTPQGTKWLEVVQVRNQEWTPNFGWPVLYYKSADRHASCADGWPHGEGQGRFIEDLTFTRAPPECILRNDQPAASAPLTLVWRIPVDDTTADPHYATTTSWMFWLDSDNHPGTYARGTATGGFTCIYPSPLCSRPQISLTILAHRTPMPD